MILNKSQFINEASRKLVPERTIQNKKYFLRLSMCNII